MSFTSAPTSLMREAHEWRRTWGVTSARFGPALVRARSHLRLAEEYQSGPPVVEEHECVLFGGDCRIDVCRVPSSAAITNVHASEYPVIEAREASRLRCQGLLVEDEGRVSLCTTRVRSITARRSDREAIEGAFS